MAFQDLPIRGKVIAIMMLASILVLLLTAAAFTLYDLYSYRQAMVAHLSTTAAIVAENSSHSLLTANEVAARQVLSALRANPQVERSGLYDRSGNLFARYPAREPIGAFPVLVGRPGHRFSSQHLVLFAPVVQDGQRIGTLFLQADTQPIYGRLRFFAGIALSVLLGSVLVAWAIAQGLQRHITSPILALAETARRVAERGDYSARAPGGSSDELGMLTNAFNQMLERVQENRARLSGVIGSAMDAIISIDETQRITAFNGAAEKMFRCSARQAIGQSLDCFLPERFREAHRHYVREFGRANVTTRAMGHLRALAARRADGEEFPIEASISQIEVGGNKIYTVILRDITERQKAQQEILALNAQLERRVEERTAELIASNKELEAFTYSVAHDLRAPLRHIDAFSRILQEDHALELSPEAKSYLETIRKGSRNMSRLVDDLLNLARVGRTEARQEPVSLTQVVEQVRADIQAEVHDRQIQWRVHPLPVIECDPGLMKQVFTNLLANSVKYTLPKPIAVIEVGCLWNQGEAYLFIRDNGVGFNMKYANKLFGVFQRLHRAEEFEGTGVGLAIVDRIVRKHGGRIWAKGEPGKGAVFGFTLSGLNKAAEINCSPPNPDPEAGPMP